MEVKENSCIDTSVCKSFVLSGLKEIVSQQIIVSSNPSHGFFTIRSTNTLHHVKIKLYDGKSGLIQNWEMPGLKEQEFHVEVTAGFYYLKIEASEGFKVLPVMFE